MQSDPALHQHYLALLLSEYALQDLQFQDHPHEYVKIQPNQNNLQYQRGTVNDPIKYSWNQTEAFMQQHFAEAEHAFIQQEACLQDGSKEEKNH